MLGAVQLTEASSSRVSFNFALCPLNCSGRGSCDLHGFCRCEAGYWGLDCGVRMNADRRPVAWRQLVAGLEHLPSPRIFVYDLDVAWRIGPQLLGEYDRALSERLLLSPHREADPLKADFFWVPGPNLQPRRKLEYIRAAWPYWNWTTSHSAKRRGRCSGPCHILTLLGERGVGDTDLRPTRSVATSLRTAELPFHASSRGRGWLSLSLNGMADARDHQASRVPEVRLPWHLLQQQKQQQQPCHVCFQPGVDIVVPPPAATIDVPTCDALRRLTATAESSPPPPRDTLLFWAGRVVPSAHRANPMYASQPNVRELILLHVKEPGFKIVDSFPQRANATAQAAGRPAVTKLDERETYAWMRRSEFCWVPPGQRYGDARRHVLAAFLGCIPVFSVPDGHHTLGELVPWPNLSVEVPPNRMHALPTILSSVTLDERERMRRRLRCARRYLWYTSIYGACAEGIGRSTPDAFEGLMQVLAARITKEHAGASSFATPACME